MGYLERAVPDEDTRRVLQEWAGYCLVPTNRYKWIMLLRGESNTGKSVFQTLLRALVGPENTSAVSMSFLDSDFGVQPCPRSTLEGELHERFRGANGARAVPGNCAGHLKRGRQQRIQGVHRVDEADPERFFGKDVASGQDQL